MGKLEGKSAIITGGSSGIGEATVRKFVAEGARVLIADIQEDKAQALADELGDAAIALATDVCNEDDIKRMIGAAHDAFGSIDALFNNAGFGGVSGEIDTTDMGEPYQRTVDAMLKGVIMGMKHVTPVMKEQGHGSIISTASVAGTGAGYGPHVYSAIKAAVINLSRSVCTELGPFNIRVNAVCPGGITTPIFAGQHAVDSDKDFTSPLKPIFAMMQPIPRAGEPEDIANTVCFLASDESDFITGQALIVDGGLTAGNWRHPDLGPRNADVIGELLGIENYEETDSVFHARD